MLEEALEAGQDLAVKADVQSPGPALYPTGNEESLDIFQ